MRINVFILIAGILLVLSGALLKIQTHHEQSSTLMLAGMVMNFYAGIALIVQISKKLSKI